MKVALLGFTVPDDVHDAICAGDASMPTQTHRFAWNLTGSLTANRVEVDLHSFAPVSDFPRNPAVIVRGGKFRQSGVPGRMIPFVNVVLAKHLSRFVCAWLFVLPHLLLRRKDWLLVHGVHSPLLWFAVLAAPLVRSKVCVVMTDPPGVVLPHEGGLRKLLKRLDVGVTRAALSKADALVVVAAPLAQDFAPGVPFVVMEGFFDAQRQGTTSTSRASGPPRVVYAGGVNAEYGVRNLVEALRRVPHLDVRLEIYGKGSSVEWVSEMARSDPRIEPVRFVGVAELSEIYARAALLVQPRPVDQAFVRYSFPSKLIEYLASGTPVLSTRLPSIPAEYEQHVLWSGDSPDELADALQEALARRCSELQRLGQEAARFVAEERSLEAQGRRLRRFLAQRP